MNESIRIVLLLVACAPVLYWLAKIATLHLLCWLSPSHEITFEYENKEGQVVHSEKIDVSSDTKFYEAITKAYKKGQYKAGELQ